MIPCKLDNKSTTFHDTKFLAYEIELPSYGKKVGFSLLDNEYFTIPYITDSIPNDPSGHHFSTQVKQTVCIILINVDESVTDKGALDELNYHQNQCGKTNVDISLCRRKKYQRTLFEDICSRFNQVRPVVSHLEVCLQKKSHMRKNIGESLKGRLR